MAPLRYYSTNRAALPTTLKEALLAGQAPDKGLYLPENIPTIPMEEIASFRGRPYAEIAYAVLRRFTHLEVDDEVLKEICKRCYDYPVPLEPVFESVYVMRLDQGPTASFKDFAARAMARLMCYFLAREHKKIVILTATSGDTGSAVAHAFQQADRVAMVVLFPRNEVSVRQRRQMTTLTGNMTVISVAGKFDDCQAMVKRAFADVDLKSIRFSSANSINIGRLLPQAVYYFYAYANLAAPPAPIVFAVPSGNFGDMMGGLIAWRMGLPVLRLVVATNANDEFPVFMQTGQYRKIIPSRVCISNAMNVGHPSNLARVIDIYGGQMDETGVINIMPDLEWMRRELFAVSIDDDETRRTIKDAYDRHHLLLEPHGAVAWAGLMRYLETTPRQLAVAIETAHPAKFPEEITKIINLTPEPPPALQGLERLNENYLEINNDYDQFKDILRQKFVQAALRS